MAIKGAKIRELNNIFDKIKSDKLWQGTYCDSFWNRWCTGESRRKGKCNQYDASGNGNGDLL